MSTRTIATVRTEAQSFVERKVTTRADLVEALPVLIELADAVKSAKRMYDMSREILTQLNDACADYALEHPSVFEEGLATSAKGVRSGDVMIDDVVYHLASGYGSPVRIDGEQLTQEFLSSLPQDWAKASWKLDTTGLNRLGVNDQQLEDRGLFRPAKNVWSAGVAA